jgi:Kef-type K+ transport system membrane component KefB
MRKTWLALGLLIAVLFMIQPWQAQEEPPASDPASPQQVTHQNQSSGKGHHSPAEPILLALVFILAGAKLVAEVFERVAMPPVLGELVFGILLGNLVLFGWEPAFLHMVKGSETIAILAELGVILLLFEVGLESNVKKMLSVGTSSLLVAILGVVVPFFLGWGVSSWFLPEAETLVHIFIGATLCATSVGITARVLLDLGKLNTTESRIILGAAVIDDVLGLLILAAVQGIIVASNTGQSLHSGEIVWLVVKALSFLVAAVWVGRKISPHLFNAASYLQIHGRLLALSLAFCFLFSWAAGMIELAPIVGAFAAGLVLDDVRFKETYGEERFHQLFVKGEHHIEELLHPITGFLVPVFFVHIGMQVDLSVFGDLSVLGFALALSVAAILGKLACSLGVVRPGLDRISVALGMMPRGEVGLIFAGVGAGLVLHGKPVIDQSVLSAVVIMVLITTLITPPVLKYTLSLRPQEPLEEDSE